MDKLTEATKLAKKLESQAENVSEAVSFVHDVVGGKLKAAEKENEFVYHEKVPDRASLPEIKGASLVKGTPFDIQDPEIAGQDIFHRLVPMEAHEASSLYRFHFTLLPFSLFLILSFFFIFSKVRKRLNSYDGLVEASKKRIKSWCCFWVPCR